MKSNKFKIRARVWIYQGGSTHSANAKAMVGAWHFITVPKKISAEIKRFFGNMARGWGSLRVSVTIGKTSWKTSIFPDKKLGAYVLPLKSDIRKKERIAGGKNIEMALEILV